ncbi:MAG: hypothetical protein ACXACP_09025, partial [Candidatus Hodarchaeales archaeon]
NHPILQEIIDWTMNFVKSLETPDKLLDIVTTCMTFHERINKPDQFRSFLFPIIEQLAIDDEYERALALYKQTIEFFLRTGYDTYEFTEQIVDLFERDQKSHIHDEQFEQAWKNIQSLFQILTESKMDDKAIQLYKNNALLFSDHRLDLALTMWTKAADLAQHRENAIETISNLSSDIQEKVLPKYLELDNQPASITLYNQIIQLFQSINDDNKAVDTVIELMRYLLTRGDHSNLLTWGEKGLELASKSSIDAKIFDITNMFFAVGKGLLSENPDVGINFIQTASKFLRTYGEAGVDHYRKKVSEIYEDLYKSEVGQELAISERENLLKHMLLRAYL